MCLHRRQLRSTLCHPAAAPVGTKPSDPVRSAHMRFGARDTGAALTISMPQCTCPVALTTGSDAAALDARASVVDEITTEAPASARPAQSRCGGHVCHWQQSRCAGRNRTAERWPDIQWWLTLGEGSAQPASATSDQCHLASEVKLCHDIARWITFLCDRPRSSRSGGSSSIARFCSVHALFVRRRQRRWRATKVGSESV